MSRRSKREEKVTMSIAPPEPDAGWMAIGIVWERTVALADYPAHDEGASYPIVRQVADGSGFIHQTRYARDGSRSCPRCDVLSFGNGDEPNVRCYNCGYQP